ncbi:FAD-binding domain-containing protein [Methylobacterium phyllosphaerae]
MGDARPGSDRLTSAARGLDQGHAPSSAPHDPRRRPRGPGRLPVRPRPRLRGGPEHGSRTRGDPDDLGAVALPAPPAADRGRGRPGGGARLRAEGGGELRLRGVLADLLQGPPGDPPRGLDGLSRRAGSGAGASRGRARPAPDLRGAAAGRTGLDGFDAWAAQLVETGWLHNHARMWFASIWIFTLRLPWELGADLFLRHLLDGDPASNTLSWRWVAGLHTPGKSYRARRDNIRRYTEGRHDPAGLDETAAPLEEAMPPREVPLGPADAPPDGAAALLLHLDDLHPESLPLGAARVVRIGGLLAHAEGAADRVRAADAAALADALGRAEAHFGCAAAPVREGWAGDLPVVTAWAPVGPSADALPRGCLRVRRAWDSAAWPRATRGFFRLRSAIPDLMGA